MLAETQSAGRGSRGRGWTAPKGNLNLSVLLRPCCPPNAGRWAFHAGVALYEALSPYTTGLLLKWPNDVLLNDHKIGGVLIDSSLDEAGNLAWVVVGIGANLVEAPVVDGRTTACLPSPSPSADTVAEAFLRHFDHWEEMDVHSAWLDRAHKPGTVIDVVTPHRRVRGRFVGLSLRGELILDGVSTPISSAEVFLPSSVYRSAASSCSWL